jgi:hypothetical protein
MLITCLYRSPVFRPEPIGNITHNLRIVISAVVAVVSDANAVAAAAAAAAADAADAATAAAESPDDESDGDVELRHVHIFICARRIKGGTELISHPLLPLPHVQTPSHHT